jgi:hypothetical protein
MRYGFFLQMNNTSSQLNFDFSFSFINHRHVHIYVCAVRSWLLLVVMHLVCSQTLIDAGNKYVFFQSSRT